MNMNKSLTSKKQRKQKPTRNQVETLMKRQVKTLEEGKVLENIICIGCHMSWKAYQEIAALDSVRQVT